MLEVGNYFFGCGKSYISGSNIMLVLMAQKRAHERVLAIIEKTIASTALWISAPICLFFSGLQSVYLLSVQYDFT